MSQNLTEQKSPFRALVESSGYRVKDSLLLAIVFLIGLAGTVYILHFAMSTNATTGYQIDDHGQFGDDEAIYFTSQE